MKKNNNKLIRIIFPIALLIVILVPSMAFLLGYYHAKNVDEYLISNNVISVESESDYYFFDNKENDDKAIIFYPGAMVEAKAYAPLANKLAQSGYDVFVTIFPLHLAFFKTNAADEIIKDTTYSSYSLMGHSLGGVIAARYLLSSKYNIDNMIFLASYADKDISATSTKCLSVYGTNDKVLNIDSYNKNKVNMPDLKELIIEGGNHGQFGSYGKQLLDGEATISAEEQWNITAKAVKDFID